MASSSSILGQEEQALLAFVGEWWISIGTIASLLFQILLLLTGGTRKWNGASRLVAWSSYNLSDYTATLVLGGLAQDAAGSGKAIYAVWAPMLLLHLGGPDNISAYAPEDAELWVRHGFNVLFQIVSAVYVIANCADSWSFWLVASCLLVAGGIKSVERTLALRFASGSVLTQAAMPIYEFMPVSASLLMRAAAELDAQADVVKEAPIVTHLLLVAALVIESYQLARIALSDWTKVWLACVYVRLTREADHAPRTTSGHRWHMRAAAAAVILEMIRLGDTVARSRYWRKRIGQCAMTQPLSACPRYELDAATVDGFKRRVVGHVLALCAEPGAPLTRLKPSLDRVFTLCGFMPEQHKASVAAALGEGFTDLEHAIANWHVATCICEALDRPDGGRKVRYDADANADANVQAGTLLSRYVAYLLVYRTEMLPCHPDIGKKTAADTGSALRRAGPWDRAHVSRLLLQRRRLDDDGDDDDNDDDRTRTWSDPNLRQGVDAARSLRGIASAGERWALIARVWVEILLWIAAANRAPEHLRQLTLGAEFLTDLWLLLGHIGACEQ